METTKDTPIEIDKDYCLWVSFTEIDEDYIATFMNKDSEQTIRISQTEKKAIESQIRV